MNNTPTLRRTFAVACTLLAATAVVTVLYAQANPEPECCPCAAKAAYAADLVQVHEHIHTDINFIRRGILPNGLTPIRGEESRDAAVRQLLDCLDAQR